MNRAAGVIVLALSQWWFVHWFGKRVRWGGSDGYEWIALALLGGAALLDMRAASPRARRGWRTAALSAWCFALLYPFLGDLARGLVAATGLAATASASMMGRGSLLPAVTLAWLSLPVVPLLQLHLGYPLRAAVGHGLAAINDLAGLLPGLRAEGAALVVQDRWILIDEPCSGVRLLWAALLLASLVSLGARLSPLRSGALMLFSMTLAVLFQAVRTAGLVALEWRMPDATWKDSFHDLSGLAAAAVLFVGICLAAHFLDRRERDIPAAVGTESYTPRIGAPSALAALGFMAAAVAPLMSFGHGVSGPGTLLVQTTANSFPGWPASFEGEPLIPTVLCPEDAAFLEHFAGQLARFSRGEDEVILAWTREPSAQMHSTAICLRGAGYRVRPAEAFQGLGGSLWSRFTASRPGHNLTARERIRDEAGGSWSDLSAWWWAALLGRTRGPWWKELVVTRLPAPKPE